MDDFTVITLVKGRRTQLANQMLGIQLSATVPREYIIVAMDDEPIKLPHTDVFPITVKRLVSESSALPLAKARNTGYQAAQTKTIIFLDVDCIPSPTLFQTLLHALTSDRIVSGYPRYLPYVPGQPWAYDDLLRSSLEHPARKNIPPNAPVEHELFWSLIFAIQKQTMEEIGGFDASYIGYGAEDTDFAYMARQAQVDLVFAPDTVLHQYHPKYDPPLNYFQDIITNATRFYEKWHTWPMEAWLDKFEAIGLIRRHKHSLEILSTPTPEMIQNTLSDSPY